MTRLALDLPALAELVVRMERYAARLAAAHDDVDRRVRALPVSWTGEAAQAHSAAHAAWSAGAAETRHALATLSSILATAHANYSAAATVNRRMWAQ
ncbi:WXG100 family type VII secretion target [uncultured Jatrophihabitans sp.]|uniref:WXG100 family type VII secretion target n=1 Tax=uncultured Jatrophihabitans sp. TaxID=1610747 RepID=UPI0035CB93C5